MSGGNGGEEKQTVRKGEIGWGIMQGRIEQHKKSDGNGSQESQTVLEEETLGG